MAERDGCVWCCVGGNLLVSSVTRLVKLQGKDEMIHEWNANGPTYLGLNQFWVPICRDCSIKHKKWRAEK